MVILPEFCATREKTDRKYQIYSSIKLPVGTNHGKVPNFYVFHIQEILAMINHVHHQATSKYVAFGWEKEICDKLDSSPNRNLSAIYRHTNRIWAGEDIEEESSLLHVAHILCRLQMFVTGILRQSPDGFVSMAPNPIIINTSTKSSACDYLTPEFVYMFYNIPHATLVTKSSQYSLLTDRESVTRKWFSKFLYFFNEYSDIFNIARLKERILTDDQHKFLIQFITETVIFSLFCKHKWYDSDRAENTES